MELPVLAVNLARARVIGTVHGEPVLSGIDKKPVADEAVFVGAMGIAGDEQADLTVHGGADKAVYAYPSEHWAWWENEHGLACGPGTFGENLTLRGGDETAVAIGDRFRWGDAILEISQPRAPCYKLSIHAARPDVPPLMTSSARCGWYFRVLVEGNAPSRATSLSRIAQSGAPSVRETFRALFDRSLDERTRVRVHDAPRLAESWRRGVAAKLRRAGG